MDWLVTFAPQIAGFLILIGGIAFFIWRSLHGGILLLFAKHDAHDTRIRRLELLAASKADNTQIVAGIMGGGK